MAKYLITHYEGGCDLLRNGVQVLVKRKWSEIFSYVDVHIQPGDTFQWPGSPEIPYEKYQAISREDPGNRIRFDS